MPTSSSNPRILAYSVDFPWAPMEHILGKCFHSSPSLTNTRLSPLTLKYEWPPAIRIDHYLRSRTQRNRTEVLSYCSELIFDVLLLVVTAAVVTACLLYQHWLCLDTGRTDRSQVSHTYQVHLCVPYADWLIDTSTKYVYLHRRTPTFEKACVCVCVYFTSLI